ncbi:hypothetical protein SEA_CECE_325 [Microbacterium phage Cece]|nr:hypothetical protein SEA_CECE_23 [Microbacterium phage Cece]UVG35331.1 hypothetical protein SEA_CECE_325 [Microbacterium phage Cece]
MRESHTASPHKRMRILMVTATAIKSVKSDSVNITNKPEVIAAAKRAAYLKTLEKIGKDAEAERKMLEDTILRPALGGADKAILRGVVAFQLGKSSNSSIDRAKLTEGWPEALVACLVKTPYTYVKYAVTPEAPTA